MIPLVSLVLQIFFSVLEMKEFLYDINFIIFENFPLEFVTSKIMFKKVLELSKS